MMVPRDVFQLALFVFLAFTTTEGMRSPVAAAVDGPSGGCTAVDEWGNGAEAEHRWMADVAETVCGTGDRNKCGFLNSKLTAIMFPGSHDAGMWNVYSGGKLRKPVATTVNSVGKSHGVNKRYITQTHDLHGQLCRGARVFDLRFRYRSDKKIEPNFYLVHPSIADGYGENVDTVIEQVSRFAMGAQHANEVVILRIKPVGLTKKQEEALAQKLRGVAKFGLLPFLAARDQNNVKEKLGSLNLNRLHERGNNSNMAKVVLLSYGFENIPPDFFEYDSETIFGRYAHVGDVTKMLTNKETIENGKWDKAGQWRFREEWASRTATNTDLMFGFWATLTGGPCTSPYDVSLKMKTRYRNFLNDLYYGVCTTRTWKKNPPNNPLIGNILWVDFYGDEEIWGYQVGVDARPGADS